jgi:alpha-N-acetylglucosaminidase
MVAVWGPPINDYACRMWSGLIRDYYCERLSRYFDGLKTGKGFDRAAWEERWVRGSGISKIEPFADPVATAAMLIQKASHEALPTLKGRSGEKK